MEEDPQKSKKKVLMIVFYFVGGLLETYSNKLMGSQIVEEGSVKNKSFFHPYILILYIFLGQSLLYVYFRYKKWKKQIAQQEGKQPHTLLVFVLPAILVILMSTLSLTAFNFISPSSFNILRGSNIIIMMIFSRFMLKMILRRNHWVGCGIAIAGVTLVGLSDFIFLNEQKTIYDNKVVGYGLLMLGLVVSAFLNAYEQKLYQKHSIQPIQMISSQGIIGMCIFIVILIIVSNVHCPFGQKGCVITDDDQYYFEHPGVYFRQLSQNWILIIGVIGFTLGNIIFAFNGTSIIKQLSALTRSMMDMCNIVLVWLIGITVTLAVPEENYKWESLYWKVILMKFFGFVLITFGVFVYSGIVLKELLVSSDVEKRSLVNNE